jgi:hypothetical protein
MSDNKSVTFYSPWAKFKLVLRTAHYDREKFAGDEEVTRVPVPGLVVKFQPIAGGGFESPNKGPCRGHAEVEDQATIARMLKFIADNQYGGGQDFFLLGSMEEVMPEESFLQQLGDGSVYCSACDKVLANAQGVKGHLGSKAHKENVARIQEDAAAKFGEAAPEVRLEEDLTISRHSPQGA